MLCIYISDIVDVNKISYGCFNLIVSSCGSGKTYFCANTLLDSLNGTVMPGEVLFVTSRSLAAKQLVNDCDITEKFDISDMFLKNSWAGLDDMSYLKDKGIRVTTYDKIIQLLVNDGYGALDNVKVLIFDECHTIFFDTYIKNIEFLKYWIYCQISAGEKLVLGLTATPRIIYSNPSWKNKINLLCDSIYKYKAKNMWVTNFQNIPELLNTELKDGKTIIMCSSMRRGCNVLCSSIPGSKLLVSRSNGYGEDASYYDPMSMDYIRNSIICKGILPDNVKTLVSTSTIREGFNIYEESGVKNIVCCCVDELDIIQLLGRCRYNVDNLVVIRPMSSSYKNEYIQSQVDMFNAFVDGVNTDWFDQIRCVVGCRPEDVKYFNSEKNSLRRVRKPAKPREKDGLKFESVKAKSAFRSYIVNRWLIKDGMTERQMKNRMLDENGKKEFIAKAAELNTFGVTTGMMSFTRIINAVEAEYDFNINRKGRSRDKNGRQFRFTTISE